MNYFTDSMMAKKSAESENFYKLEADALYDRAGDLIQDEEDQISLDRYCYVLNDEVIKKFLQENLLPFELQHFQLLALHALASKKNVILISPTGSGKMLVAQLGISVLQLVFGNKKGVGFKKYDLFLHLKA